MPKAIGKRKSLGIPLKDQHLVKGKTDGLKALLLMSFCLVTLLKPWE